MNYQLIFLRFKNLIRCTVEEWRTIAKELVEHGKEAIHPINQFALPFIGLASICAFITPLINNGELNFRIPVMLAGIVYISLYLGLFASSYLMERFVYPRFNISNPSIPALQLSAYSSVIVIVTFAAVSLLPNLLILHLCSFLVAYPVWKCANEVLEIPENKSKVVFTMICTLIIVGCPLILKGILTILATHLTF